MDHQIIWACSTQRIRWIRERVRHGAEVCLQAIWAEICDYVIDRVGKSLEYDVKRRDLKSNNIKQAELCSCKGKGDNDVQIGGIIQWQFPGIEAEDRFLPHHAQNM